MKIILNKTTNTIHKQETGTGTGRANHQTICGATNHVAPDNLRQITNIEPELETMTANKCGRCFDDGGGY